MFSVVLLVMMRRVGIKLMTMPQRISITSYISDVVAPAEIAM